MARRQAAQLVRQRKILFAEQKAAAKATARAQQLLELTLKREAQLKAEMAAEGKKLSPRSADRVRVRMLLSRKPQKLVTAELSNVGMKLAEAPRARRELDAFGQLREVESTLTPQQQRRQVGRTK